MVKISDIVRGRKPVTLKPTASVREAAQLMRSRKVGSVLVTDAKQGLLGIFTVEDGVGRVIAEGRTADATKLGEVMTVEPHTLTPDHAALEALSLMMEHGYRHMPIVAHGKVVGVISMADFPAVEIQQLERSAKLANRTNR